MTQQERRQYDHDYYLAHRERKIQQAKEWNHNHPEEYRAISRRGAAKRIARLRGGGSYTAEQLSACLDFFGHCCAYSGEPLEPGYHLDHVVPVSKGGTSNISNLVPSNSRPNHCKYTHDWEQWFVASPYYDPARLQKIKEWLDYSRKL